MTALASFEDIIYIIVGLLWVAFSFYNAKKKKNAKKGPAPVNKKKSMLESLLNEMGYEDQKKDSALYESVQEVDQYEDEPIQTEAAAEIFSYDDYYEESNSESTNHVITQESNTQVTTIDYNRTIAKEKSTNKKSKTRIDLRKAVIYSEILKKVYF